MIKVGSVYDPQYSDVELIEKFLDKNGDWRNLPQETLMYYGVRLASIRNRLDVKMVGAPLPYQSRLMSVIEKIDDAISNINSMNISKVVFSEIDAPADELNHPYVVMLRSYIGRGFDADKAKYAVAELLDMPVQVFDKFLRDHHVTISKNEVTPAYEEGRKLGSNKFLNYKFKDLTNEARKVGLTDINDIGKFIKGYCNASNLNLSDDPIVEAGIKINSLANAKPQDRGRVASDILKQFEDNEDFILGGNLYD